jgi:hypothetical protein
MSTQVNTIVGAVGRPHRVAVPDGHAQRDADVAPDGSAIFGAHDAAFVNADRCAVGDADGAPLGGADGPPHDGPFFHTHGLADECTLVQSGVEIN